MFVLRTGLQGHGKTLNTIRELDKRSVETGRTIFYNNIRDLDVNKLKGTWVPFEDPKLWYELPQNAIAVIDEAQRFFGVRSNSQAVPKYASELETMRHNGHELHCITQDPGLLDHHMRKLCNSHIHFNRPHKGKLVSRWEFERPINPSNKSEFANGQNTIMKLDSSYFGVYASTQAEHHFRWQPPRALFVLVGCALLVILGMWKLSGRFHPDEAKVEQGAQPVPAQQQVAGSADHQQSHLSKQVYVDLYQPRIPDVAASAPIYDELTVPKSFPKPSCVASTDPEMITKNQHRMTVDIYHGKLSGCRCNSQQGTRMDVSLEFCMTVAENGYFDNTRPDDMDRQRHSLGREPASVGQRDSSAGRADAGGRTSISVTGIPYTPPSRTLL